MQQKNITIFSMLGIVLAAVLVNETVIRPNEADQNRQVASLTERFEPNQIKWEQELAKTVSRLPQPKLMIGHRPNLQDRLIYEVFEGRYEAKLEEGKMKKITLMPNQVPLELKTIDFMTPYISSFKDFDTYTQTSVDPQHEQIRLKDKAGVEVGQLEIVRDDKGRVLTIELQ